MHTTPAAASQSRRSFAVNLNLGSIGRLESYQATQAGTPLQTFHDEYAVLAFAHSGLPRLARDLDCRVLPTPECESLLILAAVHHQVAYYVITNLAERSAFAAIAGALKNRRLELVLTADGLRTWWSAMRFDEETAVQLVAELQARKNAWRHATDSWRDMLGLIVTDLPARFPQHHAGASACTQHAAVLASGNRPTFLNALDRCRTHTSGLSWNG